MKGEQMLLFFVSVVYTVWVGVNGKRLLVIIH